MKAFQFQFKSTDHKMVENVVKPVPSKDEVLVRVVNTALDSTTQEIIDKEFPVAWVVHKVQNPLYLGNHYSGIVEALGSDVDAKDLQVGAAVFGFLQYTPSQTQGALAEYITVNYNDCALKPKGVSFETAAASTVEPLTALQAIRNKGGFKSGGSILVIGAAGGVGSAAVQIAKNLLGASHVTAVCGRKDVQRVKEEFGADVVIDRTSEPNYLKRLIQQKQTFDVILDTPCVLPSSATKLLKPKGTVVTTAPTGTMMWNMLKLIFSSKSAASVIVNSNRSDLNSVGNLLEADKLRVPIESTFKVNDAKTALLKENGKKSGRVVIQVENGWN